MPDKDRVEGKTEQATGKMKEKAGEISGNEELEGEGKAEEMKGKAKDTFGRLKDKVKDATN
jgi:uncharacterized protein YjbJ (UPF0337 family)